MMKINDKKIFRWIYLIGLFLIVLLPFLAFPPYFSPPDWAKAIIFRIIFSILISLFLVQNLYQKGYKEWLIQKIRAVPLLFSIPLLIFVILLVLSTIFSLEPTFSFWGSPARGDGSLNLLLYILLLFFSYLAIEKNDWKKIWAATIIGGLVVSFVAIAQQFSIASGTLVPYINSPPSTMGNPDMLATYLLLLFFITLSFGISEKIRFKKIFYFSSLTIFLFVILLTLSRATFLGLAVGFLWLILFYKFKKSYLNKIKLALIITFILLCSLLLYYANSRSTFPNFIQNNHVLSYLFKSRLSIENIIGGNGRFSAWKIAVLGIKDHSLLGYGPENFSIAFDRHYNLSLEESASWWDRAHNFLLEIGVTMGIPALLAYIAFWLAIFYILQKMKNKNYDSDYFLPNAIQATITAYFVNIFLSFDCVPTYIVSYLMLGYSLSLVTEINPQGAQNEDYTGKKHFWKFIVMIFIFYATAIFIWQYNIEPLRANAQVNWKDYYLKKLHFETQDCRKGLAAIQKGANIHTMIDNYLRLEHMDALQICIGENNINDEQKTEIAKQAIEIGQEAVKEEPYYTRTWIYLGYFENSLMQYTNDISLGDKASFYFQKAHELSPDRFEIYAEWIKTYIVLKKYDEAIKKADECIKLNPNYSGCYWSKAIALIESNNRTEAEKYINLAEDKDFDVYPSSVNQLLKIYIQLTIKNPNDIGGYRQLAGIYRNLTKQYPQNYQYHASLAFADKVIGNYQEAKTEALIVLKLSPESKATVEAFLQTLPQK